MADQFKIHKKENIDDIPIDTAAIYAVKANAWKFYVCSKYSTLYQTSHKQP